MSTAVEYGTAVFVHDGLGHFRGGLVFASRTDLGEANDSAPLTVVVLDPKFEPAGAARGNVADAVQVLHDLPYTDSADKPGYSFLPFSGETRATYQSKKAVLAATVIVPPPAPVTDSTGIQPAPVPVAIVGGVPVPVRQIGEGLETHDVAPLSGGMPFSGTPEMPIGSGSAPAEPAPATAPEPAQEER